MANCATSAANNTAAAARDPSPAANSPITSAGPTEYQPSAMLTSRRSGCAVRRATSGSSPSSEAIATSPGTHGAGVSSSSGTNTSCVGRMSPGPSWKRTRRISA